jgi:hypothetical protein
MLINEMNVNAEIINKNLGLTEKGLKEGGEHSHIYPFHRLTYSGWTLLLTSGKLSKFSGKTLGKEVISSVREMYTQTILTDQQMNARELVLYGPLRVTIINDKGRRLSLASRELDIIGEVIKGNFYEIQKKISEIKNELS